MNLLALRIADIVFEEGARYLVPEDEGGRSRVEKALEEHLRAHGVDPDRAAVHDFRLLSQDPAWVELLERLVPPETHERISRRFEELVFS